MKRVLAILSILIVSSNAFDFGKSFDLGNTDFTNILDKTNLQNNLFDNLKGLSGSGISASNGLSGNMLDICYIYKPVNSGDLFNFDICSMLPSGDANVDICSLAPDLSSFGYIKKSNTIGLGGNLNEFCKEVFGDNSNLEIKSLSTVSKNFTLEDNIIKNPPKNENNLNNEEDSFYGYKALDDSNSPLNINNIAERYKENKKENDEIFNAVASNDYNSFYVYKNIIGKSNDYNKNTKFKDLNTKYNTIKEYEDSLNKLRDTLKSLQTQLDIQELANTAQVAFISINQNTTDANERIKYKEEQSKKLQNDFFKILEKWAKIKTKLLLLDKYEDKVVYPTKEYVRWNKSNYRAKIVYNIEKQKANKVLLINQVDSEVMKIKTEAKRVLFNELVKSRFFDEEKTREYINKLVGDDN